MPRADGRITTHALGELQSRGTLFVRPQEDTYNGMVIGENSREADMEARHLDTCGSYDKLGNFRGFILL